MDKITPNHTKVVVIICKNISYKTKCKQVNDILKSQQSERKIIYVTPVHSHKYT